MGSVVLSVRVRRELKEEAERLGVNVREIVERALEQAVRDARRRKILGDLKKLGELLSDMSEDDWVGIVREVRETRVPAG